MTDDTDPWRPFGEQKWKDFAETVGASDKQLLFSVARFNGASAAKAAEIAGYSGDRDELRRAGYAAVRSTAVVSLLELAEINAPEAAGLTEAEVDAKIAKMVRSPDSNVAKAGIELFEKRKQRQKEFGEGQDDDGLSEWRLARTMLEHRNGASAFMLMFSAKGDMGHPANYPMLHDIFHVAKKGKFGQEIFDYCGRNLSQTMRKALEDQLADASYQLDQRKAIWSEIGKTPPAGLNARVDWRLKGLDGPNAVN